jgi:hypothetical protein
MSLNVPLYSSSRHLLPIEMPLEILTRHPWRFNLVKNRRGHVVRAYVKPVSFWLDQRLANGKPSAYGEAFEQKLDCGYVLALYGVTGSN